MTTPKKSEIIELAKQLYFNDMAKSRINNFNDPEPNELAEGGYIQSAKSMLMRDQYKAQVESKDFYDLDVSEFSFDVKEAAQTTTFISGSRGVGKSDIAMYIVDQLTNEGVICIVFDNSLDWVSRSSISQYITAKSYMDVQIPQQNTIIDISQLTPSEAQSCVERFCKKLFESQIQNMANKYFLVFEEAQTYFPLNSIRAKNYQNTARILCVGRNIGISACAISQFPSLADKELIKHSGQIYIGYTTEKNAVNYWKSILGKNANQLKELQNGEFLCYCRNRLGKIQVAPYENCTPKTQISAKIPELQPLPKQADTKALGSLVRFMLWLIPMIYVILRMW
jgi:hypothetical protein